MKILGIDLGLKWIVAPREKEEIVITFRCGLIRGIYDINIRSQGDFNHLKGPSATPGIITAFPVLADEIFRRIKRFLLRLQM